MPEQYVYRIREWEIRYEVNAKGDAWSEGQEKRRIALSYVRMTVHGRAMTRSNRRLNALAGDDAPAVFGVFGKLMELAADNTKDLRGWIVDSDGTPFTPDDIADILQWPVAIIDKALNILSSNDLRWIEKAPISDFSGELRGTPGNSAPNRREGNRREEKGMEEPKTRGRARTTSALGSASADSSADGSAAAATARKRKPSMPAAAANGNGAAAPGLTSDGNLLYFTHGGGSGPSRADSDGDSLNDAAASRATPDGDSGGGAAGSEPASAVSLSERFAGLAAAKPGKPTDAQMKAWTAAALRAKQTGMPIPPKPTGRSQTVTGIGDVLPTLEASSTTGTDEERRDSLNKLWSRIRRVTGDTPEYMAWWAAALPSIVESSDVHGALLTALDYAEDCADEAIRAKKGIGAPLENPGAYVMNRVLAAARRARKEGSGVLLPKTPSRDSHRAEVV